MILCEILIWSGCLNTRVCHCITKKDLTKMSDERFTKNSLNVDSFTIRIHTNFHALIDRVKPPFLIGICELFTTKIILIQKLCVFVKDDVVNDKQWDQSFIKDLSREGDDFILT